MNKVGNAGMKVVRSRGEIVPRDFAAAVKDIKLAILQLRARAAHASNVEALKLYFYVGGYVCVQEDPHGEVGKRGDRRAFKPVAS